MGASRRRLRLLGPHSSFGHLTINLLIFGLGWPGIGGLLSGEVLPPLSDFSRRDNHTRYAVGIKYASNMIARAMCIFVVISKAHSIR
jgi:hypothetical protein